MYVAAYILFIYAHAWIEQHAIIIYWVIKMRHFLLSSDCADTMAAIATTVNSRIEFFIFVENPRQFFSWRFFDIVLGGNLDYALLV